MSGKSAIYRGQVTHARQAPIKHRFRYDLSLLAIDLDDVPELFAKRFLVSAQRPAPWRFQRSDYHGPADQPLKEAVAESIAKATGSRPEGPIVLLTQLRSFGFIFNPVSFYFAYNGDQLHSVLAEITNTPWLERHHYVLGADQLQSDLSLAANFAKSFHISPFMAMNQDYFWQFSDLSQDLRVYMRTTENRETMLEVQMQLQRQDFNTKNLNALLLRQPFMTLRVALGIYWQALRLKWKGLTFFDHPKSIITPKECPES